MLQPVPSLRIWNQLLPAALLLVVMASHLQVVWSQNESIPSLWTRKKGDDWPEFLGPGRDSKSRETGILKDWTDGKLKIKWTRPLEESYGIGSVAKGRYFQFDRIDGQEVLICLNAETGKEIWKKSYPTEYRDLYGYNSGPRTSPIIDGDRVYTFGVAGDLRCQKVLDGSLVWSVDTNTKFGVIQNFFGVGSTPVIFENLIIVMVGGSPDESKSLPPGALDRVKGNGSGVVAFDKMTGKVRYQFSDELASYSSLQLAKLDGLNWCFAFCRGGLIGFDPATGKQRFHYPWRDSKLESVNASNPVVIGHHVFISETYGIGSSYLKVKPDGVEVVWKDEKRARDRAMETHWNTAVHHQGFLYGSSGRHTSEAVLKCIEAKTGRTQWTVPRLSRSSLLYVDGHFVCLTEYGGLFLFRATESAFELVTQIRLNVPTKTPSDDTEKTLLTYPCWAAPVLSHGLLYVRGKDHLVCLELIPQ